MYGAHPFGTAEAIDVHTALRSYTAWAAHQLFLEDKIGTIEPGKEADHCGLGSRPLHHAGGGHQEPEMRTDAVQRTDRVPGSDITNHYSKINA